MAVLNQRNKHRTGKQRCKMKNGVHEYILFQREVVVQVNEKGLGLAGIGNKDIHILHAYKFRNERRTLRAEESHGNVACLDLSKNPFEVHKICS